MLGEEFTFSTALSQRETYSSMYICTYLLPTNLSYALSRNSSELLINRQWKLSEVERTEDTTEDTSEPFERGN